VVLTSEIINDETRLKDKEFFERNSKDAEGGDASINIRILLESIIPYDFTEFLCPDTFKLESSTESFILPSIKVYSSQEDIKELPNILQIHNGKLVTFTTVPKKVMITLNEKTEEYELEASTLGVDGIHAISGLICNDIQYIYDSNNVIAVTDWSDNKYDEYLNAVKEQHITNYAQTKDSMKGMSAVIYIKSSFKKEVEDYFQKASKNGGRKKNTRKNV